MSEKIKLGTFLPGAIPLSLMLTLTFGLAGCGDERSKDNVSDKPVAFKVSTPAEIAQESAENYDDNVNGLITGQTLKHWISDWEKNRPKGITGKLVIFQADKGPAGFEYIKPDNRNIFTYVEGENNEWREPRDNGVTEFGHIVVSGPSIDKLIRRYGVDVKNDLIVCALGKAGSNQAMNQGRCWYTFRYWGVDERNLAVLNGGNNYLSGGWSAADFTSVNFSGAVANQPSPIINKQISSVKDLPVDNTILQATLSDLIDVLPTTGDVNVTDDGVFLWDGRSIEQFSAGEDATSPSGAPTGAPYANRYHQSVVFQNGGTRQSHPRGAAQLVWTSLIDTTTGLYKTKAQIKAYLDGYVDGDGTTGQGFIDGTYQHLGVGNAYQKGDIVYLWCETAARAAVTTIASAVILGLPTRLYDASMIEWNSLTGGAVDKDGIAILPADSPWRTDVLSEPVFPNQANQISARNAWSDPENPLVTTPPRITDPYGEDSHKIIKADKAYKAPPAPDNSGGNGSGSGGSGSGGGVVLPPNPCG